MQEGMTQWWDDDGLIEWNLGNPVRTDKSGAVVIRSDAKHFAKLFVVSLCVCVCVWKFKLVD